nr:hypothetical protein [Tanacetum cinerariifolium]
MELYNECGRSQPAKVVRRYWERHRCQVVGRVVVAAAVVNVEAGRAHFSANVDDEVLASEYEASIPKHPLSKEARNVKWQKLSCSSPLLQLLHYICSGIASQPAIAAVTTRITGEDISISKPTYFDRAREKNSKHNHVQNMVISNDAVIITPNVYRQNKKRPDINSR